MLTGKNQIGLKQSSEGSESFQAVNPATNGLIDGKFIAATSGEVETAVGLAVEAFEVYKKVSAEDRAAFLECIADEMLALDSDLVQRAMEETGLPEARIIGERGRTMGQLKMFAAHIREGSWVEATIDTALQNRAPVPKPDLRKMLHPIGPVVVFGASNFPLAYSTMGGDSASVLAAGNPVIVKAHPSHPGTSELVGQAVIAAINKCGMPEGVFSQLHDSGYEVGTTLVKHPSVKAVGFTGSLRGGRTLFDIASQRKEPIPVYAEMGSTNPVFILPKALENRAAEVAKTYAGSITLGAGQFCTNPGIMVGIKGDGLNTFKTELGLAIKSIAPSTMLNPGIQSVFENSVEKLLNDSDISTVGVSENEALTAVAGRPTVASVSGETFIANPKYHEEVFGPYSLIVECADENQMMEVAKSMDGQLTTTVIADSGELNDSLISVIKERTGRLIFNGVPTGVEVCTSMMHGGPYPASSNGKYSSVGSSAISRFARPISYQSWPEALLPHELRNENPNRIWRTVDGEFTKDEVK